MSDHSTPDDAGAAAVEDLCNLFELSSEAIAHQFGIAEPQAQLVVAVATIAQLQRIEDAVTAVADAGDGLLARIDQTPAFRELDDDPDTPDVLRRT